VQIVVRPGTFGIGLLLRALMRQVPVTLGLPLQRLRRQAQSRGWRCVAERVVVSLETHIVLSSAGRSRDAIEAVAQPIIPADERQKPRIPGLSELSAKSGPARSHCCDCVPVTAGTRPAMFRSIHVPHAGRATRYDRGGCDMKDAHATSLLRLQRRFRAAR
jgi:hypothetical protein